MKLKAFGAAVLALSLGLGGAVVATTAASAHTPNVSADCQTLTVNLTQYAATVAAKPGQPTYQRYSWTGGKLDSAPTTAPPGANWQENTSNYHKDDPVGQPFQRGNGNNASWFYWLSTPGAEIPAKANTVKVVIDGATVTDTTFGQSFSQSYNLGDKYVAHSYSVAIVAHDGPNNSAWSKTITGTTTPCVRPDVTVPIQLTYMEGCPVDTTNTWRFRNTGDRTVTVRLSDGNTHQATVGDSFYETPRGSTTLTAQWGGPGTGVVAGQTVKASGNDKAPSNIECTGPQPPTEVVRGAWVVGEFECGDTRVTETREVTTTTYALVNNKWVGTPVVTTETNERDLTPAEIESLDCPILTPCVTTTTGGFSTQANPNGWSFTETRTAGSNTYAANGLVIETVPSANGNQQSKAAGYKALDIAFSDLGVPQLNLTDTSGVLPSIQILVDFDGNGTTDGILVGETVYGDDYWLTNGSAQFVKDDAPNTGGGSGSPYFGTLQEWLNEFTDARVDGFGYSLGSGVVGKATIESIVIGCATYTFGVPAQPEPTTRFVDTEVQDCETGTVVTVRDSFETPFVYNEQGVWVPGTEIQTSNDVFVSERPMTDEERLECAGEQPETDVVTGDWVTGEYDCDDTTVEETRTVTTTEYVLVGTEWVAAEPVVTTETQTRSLTDAEIEALDCPVAVTPPTKPTTPVAVGTPVSKPTLPVTGPSEIAFGLGGLALLAVIGGVLLKRREALQD